jgi:hypothetical protein
VKAVGPTVIKGAFQNLTPNDTWQNFYQENKKFLAAEVNFWSPFEGEALADGKPRDPVALGPDRRWEPEALRSNEAAACGDLPQNPHEVGCPFSPSLSR